MKRLTLEIDLSENEIFAEEVTDTAIKLFAENILN